MTALVSTITSTHLQEPWTFPRGGKDRSRHISLEAMVCQTLSGIQYMARPKTRSLLPTITGMFGTLKHVNRGYYDLCYHLGMTIRWETMFHDRTMAELQSNAE